MRNDRPARPAAKAGTKKTATGVDTSTGASRSTSGSGARLRRGSGNPGKARRQVVLLLGPSDDQFDLDTVQDSTTEIGTGDIGQAIRVGTGVDES